MNNKCKECIRNDYDIGQDCYICERNQFEIEQLEKVQKLGYNSMTDYAYHFMDKEEIK